MVVRVKPESSRRSRARVASALPTAEAILYGGEGSVLITSAARDCACAGLSARPKRAWTELAGFGLRSRSAAALVSLVILMSGIRARLWSRSGTR
jgi:hypothetical protein